MPSIADTVANVLRQFGIPLQHRIGPGENLGGLSGAEFWRIESEGHRLLLRRWPVGGPSPDKLLLIHDALRHAASHGINCLPVPLKTTAGSSMVEASGRMWELTPWLPGQEAGTAWSDTQLTNAVQTLARFHQAMADFKKQPGYVGTPPSLIRRIEKWREASQASWLTTADLNSRPDLAPVSLATELRERVTQRLPTIGRQLQRLGPCETRLRTVIGDVRQEHVLFTGNAVTGLVDFGALAFDSPMIDLARLLGESVGKEPTTWHQGVAAYRTVCPLTDVELNLLPVFHDSGLVLAGYNWLDWLFNQQREFSDPQSVRQRLETLSSRIASPHRLEGILPSES